MSTYRDEDGSKDFGRCRPSSVPLEGVLDHSSELTAGDGSRAVGLDVPEVRFVALGNVVVLDLRQHLGQLRGKERRD